MKKTLKCFKDGIFRKNPSLVLMLGLCPLLATSTSLKNGIAMGLVTTAVLICSNTVISLLRKIIPESIRTAACLVVSAAFVTAAEMLMKAYFGGIYEALGIFVPLIAVNCIILARAESFAFENGAGVSAIDGLAMGLGFTLALVLMSFVRELLGSGTVFGLSVFPEQYGAVLMIMPVGGFITLGFLTAIFRRFASRFAEKEVE